MSDTHVSCDRPLAFCFTPVTSSKNPSSTTVKTKLFFPQQIYFYVHFNNILILKASPDFQKLTSQSVNQLVPQAGRKLPVQKHWFGIHLEVNTCCTHSSRFIWNGSSKHFSLLLSHKNTDHSRDHCPLCVRACMRISNSE